MKSVVWILSKGRPNPSFSQKLSAECIDHVIWVEPQEHKMYRDATTSEYVTFRVLPKDDQGVTYVRQVMLDAARHAEVQAWMMDDDILGFFRMLPIEPGWKARKRQKISIMTALTEAQDKFITNKLSYGCLIHNAFAIFGAPGMNFRKLDYGSVWIDGSIFPKSINYNGIRGREDLYLAIQHVLDGNRAACDNDISVNHQPSADTKAVGGLASWYANWQSNVLTANAQLESLLDTLQLSYINLLDTKMQKDLKDLKLYRQYVMAHGPRKGSIDTRPKWASIIKLRNAIYANKLTPL